MRVLVTVASRHGSTWLLGDAIREELTATGSHVTFLEPQLVDDIDGFDAVVLGSGVYAGRWLGSARAFARRFERQLGSMPVWLFSSGPIGEPAKPVEPPAEAVELARRLGARDHQVFGGSLEPDKLGLAERLIVRAVGAEGGDNRPWVAVTLWARAIAAELAVGPDAEPADAAHATPAVAR